MSGERTVYQCEFAWLGGDHAVAEVAIVVVDGTIESVEETSRPAADAVRLPGLTIPGLANVHSHAFHRGLRSRTQAGIGSFWTWREQMYRLAGRLDPDTYFLLARAVYAEMVSAGMTAVGEFHYLHHQPGGVPYADPNAMGAALAAAAEEAGIRLTLLDTCYLQGGFGVALDGVQSRFGDGDVARWVERAAARTALASPSVRLGAAIHSVRAVDAASIELVSSWSRSQGLALHAHVSEQPAENEQCLAATGRSPSELLADHGALGEWFTAIHATHLTDDDLTLLGGAGVVVGLCPTTERDLADGVGPARALRDAGARLALGSDSHAVVDLFEEARAVELDERLVTRIRGSHDAPSLLRAATANGYASLGWATGGVLQPGALADFVTVDLRSVRTAGVGAEHAVEAAVFAATAGDIQRVVVGGRLVADAGHRSIDVARELHDVVMALTE